MHNAHQNHHTTKLYTYHRKKSSTVVFHISFKNMRVRFFNRNDFTLVHSDAVTNCTRLFVLKLTATLSFCICMYYNNYTVISIYIQFLQFQNHFDHGRPIKGDLLHSAEEFHWFHLSQHHLQSTSQALWLQQKWAHQTRLQMVRPSLIQGRLKYGLVRGDSSHALKIPRIIMGNRTTNVKLQ